MKLSTMLKTNDLRSADTMPSPFGNVSVNDSLSPAYKKEILKYLEDSSFELTQAISVIGETRGMSPGDDKSAWQVVFNKKLRALWADIDRVGLWIKRLP